MLQRQSTICELTFPTTVLAVRMNRKRLVVVLEDQIYLYDISNMKLLYTMETSPNPHGTLQHQQDSVEKRVTDQNSHLHTITLVRKLLPSLSPPTESGTVVLCPTLSRPTRRCARSAYERRRPPLRHYQARGNQRSGSTPLASVLHRRQRHRDPPGHRLRQGHHHPCLFYSLCPQALPIQTRLYAL